MYRKSLERNINSKDTGIMEIQFVNRVTQLPVVTASWNQLLSVYTHAKDSNRLLNYTLGKAETGVVGVAATAAPLINKFEKPLNVLDGFACVQLDKLEQMYPIINKPADVWVNKGMEVYNTSVKPSVDMAVSVKNASLEKCAMVYDVTVKPSIETYNKALKLASDTTTAVYKVTLEPAVNTATAAKDYSKQKMQGLVTYGVDKAGEALNSSYGKVLQTKVDDLVKVADNYVDYYLPANPDEKPEVMEGENTIVRARNLSSKTRHRMYQKAIRDLQNMKLRTQEAINNLKHTIDLIQYERVATLVSDAKTVAIDGAKMTSNKLKYYWEEMNKTGEEVENTDPANNPEDKKSMERRLIATARHLTQKIKYGVSVLSNTASSLMPAAVASALMDAKKHTHDLYTSFTNVSSIGDMTNSLLEQTKEKLEYVSQTLSFAADYTLNTVNLSWLKKQEAAEAMEVEEVDSSGTDTGAAVPNGVNDAPCENGNTQEEDSLDDTADESF